MTTIYIIKNDVGDYDDHREHSLCAVTTEERAIALVQQFSELNKFNCSFDERVRNEFRRVWENEHLHPEMPQRPKAPDGFHELQRALSAKPPAKEFLELKELFKKFQNQHDENLRLHKVELSKYHEQLDIFRGAYKAAELEWYNKNYILPPHLSEVSTIADEGNHYSNLGNEYSYYELTLLQ